jgi:hypothetical protein
MAGQPKRISAPCSTCVRDTLHEVLFETRRQDDHSSYAYVMISCGGCETISMGVQSRFGAEPDLVHEYYPSPVSRKQPQWLAYMRLGLDRKEEAIGDLLHEVYQAIFGKQYRLAAMGIRAALEQVMIIKVGDSGTFNSNLDAFERDGYISKIQREQMRATLDIGDAAMHRGFVPTEKELKIALDVVEGVMAPIFGHGDDAKHLTKRVPPRAER